MELKILTNTDSGYVYSIDERIMVNLDIFTGYKNETADICVTVTSADHTYKKEYNRRKTLAIRLDNLEFYFNDLKLGNYLVEATVKCGEEYLYATEPLSVVAYKIGSPANNYNWKLPVGEGKNHNFSNFDFEGAAPTPAKTRSSDYYGKVDTDLELPTNKSGIDKKTAKFFFENDRYAYAITKDNKEIIAYKEKGGYIDVLAGGGSFNIFDSNGNVGIEGGKLLGFEKCENGVEVSYEAGGTAKGAVIKTKYTFNENCISVAVNAKYSGDVTLISGLYRSYLKREFLNELVDSYNSLNFDWRYPVNNDFPYRYTECWSIANTIDKNHRVYTFNRGDIPLNLWNYHNCYPKENLCTFFGDTNNLDYTLTYDLVLADRRTTENVDYISIFEGKNSDFAAGIAPVIENDDNSTLFVRDTVDLNLNVTNLIKEDTVVSIKYDIRDYYGKVLETGEFYDEVLAAKGEINRVINVNTTKHGYGMFFINFMVQSKKHTYRDYYSFALLDNYEYKYNATSKFGIVQIHPNRSIPFSDSFSLCNKIGVAVTRGGFIAGNPKLAHECSEYDISLKYCKLAKEKGIRVVAHGSNEDQIINFGQFFTECMAGNEINGGSFMRKAPMEECYQEFMKFFEPLEAACRKHGKTLMHSGISAGQTEWYDYIYKKGLWDRIDKMSVHVYGIPYSPECPERLDHVWSTEGGLIRTVDAIRKYGEKPWQVNEMGYQTAKFDTCVDLRTQANYNDRTYILCLAYGAEHAAAYCFYDISGSGLGTLPGDMEYHFGYFYMPDYYGRILPKPAALTYATMTRVLESADRIYENFEYSKNHVRAFTATTKEHGDVLVAWSLRTKLPNDLGEVENNTHLNTAKREPTMPWQNQWKDTQWILVRTENDHVTLVDEMGKKTISKARHGVARVPLTGAPIYVLGAKLDENSANSEPLCFV